MDDKFRTPTSREKALHINLNSDVYGAFSEIGAGQEVAGTFFQAGASSGTIALSHSAYDMKISDSFYGESGRYVSARRLDAMLDHDYRNLLSKLEDRKSETKFFAYANTIETLNYFKTNQGHGWMGVRFQLTPDSEPNTCVLHCQLKDNDTLLQQKAVGRLGVNLVYACYHYNDDKERFLESLMDGIAKGRIEIDMFNMSGPDFENWDNRLISLKLVKKGLTPAAMFGSDGNNLQPSEALYKKNILVLRGRFRPPTLVNVDMLLSSYRQFKKEKDVKREDLTVLCELTLNNLMNKGENIDEKDFLDRVDILCSLGQTVIITNFQRYYKLITYLSDVNRERKIGVVLGINNLAAIFDRKFYTHLKGGILEAFGMLFGRNVKLLIYPSATGNEDGLHTIETFEIEGKLSSLFDYLKENNQLEDIQNVNKENLTIYSDDVLEKIKKNESGWEKMVPTRVAHYIKEKGLFEFTEKKSKKKRAAAVNE